jgi:glycosyltransferase involved in cell wall biosynthesis
LTRVHQVLSGAGPVDAVTAQAFAYRRAFSRWGMEGGVHAAAIEPAVRTQVEPLKRLEPAPGDVLLFHYSAYAPRLEPLLEWPQRKLLVYHNVTPAEWLWEHQPHVATLCALGRDHLPRWARGVDVAAAVSEYNAHELRAAGARATRVVPILMERDGRAASRPTGGPPRILSVGRLAPHKRPELVLRAFELYRHATSPEAVLDMVGEALSPRYERELRELAGEGVTIHGRLPQAELDDLWERADVFLTLSAHEGFCVPLLEAFHAGVPVVASPSGGMPEVAADAALWADDDPAVVAELLDLAVRDEQLRAELIERGNARAEAYDYDVVVSKLRGVVDEALGIRNGRNAAMPDA